MHITAADLLGRDQDLPVPLPAVLGREGAGRVERVGAEVARFVPGDRVILTPSATADNALLYEADLLGLNLSGSRPDGSSPLRRNTEQIAGVFFGQSSLASHALVTERNTVKIDDDVPFPMLAPLGGDVQTGAGAVINTLRPRPGSAIAIFGAGAVGLSAVMAARLCGCHPIIAVDIKASRLQLAESIGATHTIDPDGLDPVEANTRNQQEWGGVLGRDDGRLWGDPASRQLPDPRWCLRFSRPRRRRRGSSAEPQPAPPWSHCARQRVWEQRSRPLPPPPRRVLPARPLADRSDHLRVRPRQNQPSRR